MALEFSPENIQESKDLRMTRNEFIEPFDESKVVNEFRNPKILEKNFYNYIVYDKQFSGEFHYIVFCKDENEETQEGKKLDFCLTSNYMDWEQYASSFILTEKIGQKGVFDFHHRHMKEKYKDIMNISGTDYLDKIEKYFSILKSNNLLDIEKIQADVSQLSVISWLLKNNYKLNKNSKFNNFEEYFEYKNNEFVLGQDGRIQLNNNYCLVPLEDRSSPIPENEDSYHNKDAYIINKNFLTDPKFEELRNKYYVDGTGKNLGKKVLIYTKGRRGGDVVDDLVKAGVMPRFILEKEIQ